MAIDDPKMIIDRGPMRTLQWVAVLITVGLNALDGFDVLSISFAAPGIAKEWGVDRAILGWILSMELLGMALGSIALGGVADKVGRRPTILGCLVAMTIGMAGAAHAGNVTTLLAFRLLTGLGIGGMLAAINAVVAEFSNQRWRSLAMAFMVIGYPLGGVFGGLVVQRLLAHGTWRDVFVFGAWATGVFLPIVWFWVPESVALIDRKRGVDALAKINRILLRLGHAPIDALTAVETATKRSLADIFKPGLAITTLIVTFAYFTHMTSFYFILKWVPKIVVDLGFAPSTAAGVLTWANVGGASGGAIFGLIATRTALKRLSIITILLAAVMIIWFGHSTQNFTVFTLSAALAGMMCNSAVVGLYGLFAKVFPTHVRATGTGFAIGVGRGGAALAPVLAGYLFQAGYALPTVALIMATGSMMSAVALLGLKERDADWDSLPDRHPRHGR